MDFSRKQQFVVDRFVFYKRSFSLHKMFIDELDYLWIIVMFYQPFGLILTAPIHCK